MDHEPTNQRPNMIERFISLEAFAGILLLFALAITLIVNNTALTPLYNAFVDLPIHITVGTISIKKPLVLWLNDGLMALFFLLLSLEIKRELIEGELAQWQQVRLPLLAACGGILLPIGFYWLFTHNHPELKAGWPIPIATDIAFVLGIMALLGRSVPKSLRVTMVALSIVDDVLAIAIIAIVYTSKLSWISLLIAGIGTLALITLNLAGVKKLSIYLLIGVVIWVGVLKSGIHATLAGVIVGLCIPIQGKANKSSPLKLLEHKLHPWVAYIILPLFVFCNGGQSFAHFSLSQLTCPISLGIIFGLVFGKSIGVFLACWLCLKVGWADMPENCHYRHLAGLALLCGIGFTMSLFINSLAFTLTPYEDLARQAILGGSTIACLLAVLIFKGWPVTKPTQATPPSS